MPANTTPIFTVTPRFGSITFASGSGTTPVSVFTAGAFGSRVTSIYASSAEAVDNVLFTYINDGAGEQRLVPILLPAGAGVTGTPPPAPASVLTDPAASFLPHDNNDNTFADLPAGAQIFVSLGTNATAEVQVSVLAQDY